MAPNPVGPTSDAGGAALNLNPGLALLSLPLEPHHRIVTVIATQRNDALKGQVNEEGEEADEEDDAGTLAGLGGGQLKFKGRARAPRLTPQQTIYKSNTMQLYATPWGF